MAAACRAIFFVRKWPVHFTEAYPAGVITNFVLPWSEAKLNIFDIIQKTILKTFGPLRFAPRIASALGAQTKCELK